MVGETGLARWLTVDPLSPRNHGDAATGAVEETWSSLPAIIGCRREEQTCDHPDDEDDGDDVSSLSPTVLIGSQAHCSFGGL